MSGSDAIELTGVSEETSPTLAIREALAQIFAQMGPAGLAPQFMTAASFETDRPQALHPSRMEVDLAWREAFGGFRPPLEITPSQRRGLVARIAFRRGPAPDPAISALAGEYSPRRQTDMTALFGKWSEDGAAFRAGHDGLDLAYGPGPFERLDLYRPPGARPAPLWVFIHGGYWQASDKAQHAQFAEGMLKAGYAVAMPDYGLAPDTPLETAVAQAVAALQFLDREARALGLEASPPHLCGHSAGAHLAAMAATQPGAPKVASLLLLSGLFDLVPLGALPLGRLLGLDDGDRAAALSPVLRPAPDCPVALAYGGKESAAFAGQSSRMAQAWAAPAPMVDPDAHHFSLLEPLRSGGALLDLALSLAGGARR